MDAEIISEQLKAVFSDLKPKVIKTGMLYSSEIIKVVIASIEEYIRTTNVTGPEQMKLVVDPVMLATTTDTLIDQNNDVNGFITELKRSLFPKATIITPNLIEAGKILGRQIKTRDDMKAACCELYELGPKYVLLKGGHAKSEKNAVDLLFNGEFFTYESPRLAKDVHGTGCTFASLIAGYIAKSFSIPQAVELAKKKIYIGIENSLSIGDGVEVVNISSRLGQGILDDKNEIITKVMLAADQLISILKPYFIPEVGINIGYATKEAKNAQDICALTGRIIRVGQGVEYLGRSEFSASKHIARIILSAMNFDPEFRSAMNIKYRPEIIQTCEELTFTTGSFKREFEPEEQSSMEWGTTTVIEKVGQVPDVIYDTGGIGKEPMIRILGKEPEDVLGKLRKIVEKFDQPTP